MAMRGKHVYRGEQANHWALGLLWLGKQTAKTMSELGRNPDDIPDRVRCKNPFCNGTHPVTAQVADGKVLKQKGFCYPLLPNGMPAINSGAVMCATRNCYLGGQISFDRDNDAYFNADDDNPQLPRNLTAGGLFPDHWTLEQIQRCESRMRAFWHIRAQIELFFEQYAHLVLNADFLFGHLSACDSEDLKPPLGRYWARQIPPSLCLRIMMLFTHNPEARRCVIEFLQNSLTRDQKHKADITKTFTVWLHKGLKEIEAMVYSVPPEHVKKLNAFLFPKGFSVTKRVKCTLEYKTSN